MCWRSCWTTQGRGLGARGRRGPDRSHGSVRSLVQHKTVGARRTSCYKENLSCGRCTGVGGRANIPCSPGSQGGSGAASLTRCPCVLMSALLSVPAGTLAACASKLCGPSVGWDELWRGGVERWLIACPSAREVRAAGATEGAPAGSSTLPLPSVGGPSCCGIPCMCPTAAFVLLPSNTADCKDLCDSCQAWCAQTELPSMHVAADVHAALLEYKLRNMPFMSASHSKLGGTVV